METSATRVLADFSASTKDIPDELIGQIEECVLDLAGHSAFSARYAESSPAFRTGARALEPQGAGFTVMGDPGEYSQLQAAMLNGAFAHTMDFDDTNVYGVLHPGAPVISAALAVAEAGRCSGQALLESIAVGYEVASRIGAALGESAYDRGFHVTGVAGIFGAVAAAGRLRGLDGKTLDTAFGLAGSLACGSMQYLENGAWNKRLHPGFAAQSALMALSFAQTGVLGASDAVAGRYGLLNGYSNQPRPERLTENLGQDWVAKQTGIKPYPSCRLTHGAIDAALALREKVPAAERSKVSLEVVLSPKGFDIVGEPIPSKISPRNIVDGQFSVYFQVACAWMDGRADWQSYERLGHPDIEAMAEQILVRTDVLLKGPAARLQVVDWPGASIDVQEPSGEPSTPLGRAKLTQKYLSLATPVYGALRAHSLAETLLSLRTVPLAADVIRSLRAPN
jgi:2-methylcitrate dehydratase PrpD